MKRDPFPNAVDLGKPPNGGWKFKAENNYVIVNHNFWRLAQQVRAYRKSNRMPNKNFEDTQMEILVYIRKERGFKSDGSKVVLETLSDVQKFVEKRYHGRGCHSCGGRR